jgi:uncharacterized membrane protein
VRALFRSLSIVFLFVYPFAVFFLLDEFGPGPLGALLVFLILARYPKVWRKYYLLLALAAVVVLGFLILDSSVSAGLLKLYPVLISLAFLIIFGGSLLRPPTIIERFAAGSGVVISAPIRRYTRQVTIVWCVFFVMNSAVSFFIGLYGSMDTWLFYNGFLSYLLMGSLLGGEFLFRRRIVP